MSAHSLVCGAQTRIAPTARHWVAVVPEPLVKSELCATAVRVWTHVLWQPMHLAQIRTHARLVFVLVECAQILTFSLQDSLALQTWIALLVHRVKTKYARLQA